MELSTFLLLQFLIFGSTFVYTFNDNDYFMLEKNKKND